MCYGLFVSFLFFFYRMYRNIRSTRWSSDLLRELMICLCLIKPNKSQLTMKGKLATTYCPLLKNIQNVLLLHSLSNLCRNYLQTYVVIMIFFLFYFLKSIRRVCGWHIGSSMVRYSLSVSRVSSHKVKLGVKLKSDYEAVLHMPVLKECKDRVPGSIHISQSYPQPGEENIKSANNLLCDHINQLSSYDNTLRGNVY